MIDLQSFRNTPEGETNAQKIERWLATIRFVEAGLRQGAQSSQDDLDWYYFIKEKIDDWNSDYDPTP